MLALKKGDLSAVTHEEDNGEDTWNSGWHGGLKIVGDGEDGQWFSKHHVQPIKLVETETQLEEGIPPQRWTNSDLSEIMSAARTSTGAVPQYNTRQTIWKVSAAQLSLAASGTASTGTTRWEPGDGPSQSGQTRSLRRTNYFASPSSPTSCEFGLRTQCCVCIPLRTIYMFSQTGGLAA